MTQPLLLEVSHGFGRYRPSIGLDRGRGCASGARRRRAQRTHRPGRLVGATTPCPCGARRVLGRCTAEWGHGTHDPQPASHPDSFGARSVLSVNGRDYEIFSLKAPALAAGHDVEPAALLDQGDAREPAPARGLPHVSADDIVAIAAWGANPEAHGQGAGDAAHEIALTPERVLMQDFTGVPGVVDLAAMRDALARLGGNASQVNPLVPVELVIDHSVIVERSGDASAYDPNVSIEYERNMERYKLLRWAQGAFDGFRAVPPAWASATRSTSSTCPGVVFATAGRPGLLRHAGRHRFAHHHGQRAGRPRLGRRGHRGRGGHAGTAALHAAAPRGRACASPGSCGRAPPRPTSS